MESPDNSAKSEVKLTLALVELIALPANTAKSDVKLYLEPNVQLEDIAWEELATVIDEVTSLVIIEYPIEAEGREKTTLP